MNFSFWEKTTFLPKKDCIILGSGIVGINAALSLREQFPNRSILIVEKGALPSGASTKNAGFACFGSISELLDDLETHSEIEMLDLVDQRWRGLQQLRERLGDVRLDFHQWGGYELFMESDNNLYKNCVSKIDYFNKIISPIIKIQNPYVIADGEIDKFGFNKTEHLILNKGEGQIDTGKMMAGLIALAKEKGIEFLNGIEIKHIEETSHSIKLHTIQNAILEAEQLLIATNGFTQKLFPNLSVQPARNQVLVTSPVPNLKIKGTFHFDKGYYYFRNINNRILFGGGRNLDLQNEMTDNFGTTVLIQNKLKDILENIILPGQKPVIDSWWSGILGVGSQKKPIVQKLSERQVVAVRLGGMGVAIGSLIGEQGAKLLS